MFFALIHALTERLPEFVASFVAIERVPSLLPTYRRQMAARSCAYTHPWSSALLALVDVLQRPKGLGATQRKEFLRRAAGVLGISEGTASEGVGVLIAAGVLDERLRITGSLRSDTRGDPASAGSLRRHWAEVSRARLDAPGERDLFSFNVFSVSHADYERIRALQLDFFRRVQALVTETGPAETAALMVLHLLRWPAAP